MPVHPWSKEHEKILKTYRARSFVNMWMQLRSGYYFIRLNDYLTYPIIFISSVSSAALFISDNNVIRLIIAILSTINVIMTGLLIECSPGQKKEQHMACMKQYLSLIRTIDFCLNIPRNMRSPPITFLDRVNSQMETIECGEYVVPRHIVRNFEKRFGSIDKLFYGEEIANLIVEDIKHFNIIMRESKKMEGD